MEWQSVAAFIGVLLGLIGWMSSMFKMVRSVSQDIHNRLSSIDDNLRSKLDMINGRLGEINSMLSGILAREKAAEKDREHLRNEMKEQREEIKDIYKKG